MLWTKFLHFKNNKFIRFDCESHQKCVCVIQKKSQQKIDVNVPWAYPTNGKRNSANFPCEWRKQRNYPTIHVDVRTWHGDRQSVADAMIHRSVDFVLSQTISIFVRNFIPYFFSLVSIPFFSRCLYIIRSPPETFRPGFSTHWTFFLFHECSILHFSFSIFQPKASGKKASRHVICLLCAIEKPVEMRKVHKTIAEQEDKYYLSWTN